MRPGPITARLDAAVARANESPLVDVARRAIEVLTAAERAALFAEFVEGA
jgi:hypothetical protein